MVTSRRNGHNMRHCSHWSSTQRKAGYNSGLGSTLLKQQRKCALGLLTQGKAIALLFNRADTGGVESARTCSNEVALQATAHHTLQHTTAQSSAAQHSLRKCVPHGRGCRIQVSMHCKCADRKMKRASVLPVANTLKNTASEMEREVQRNTRDYPLHKQQRQKAVTIHLKGGTHHGR